MIKIIEKNLQEFRRATEETYQPVAASLDKARESSKEKAKKKNWGR